MELSSKKSYYNLVLLIGVCLFTVHTAAQCESPALPNSVVFKNVADYRSQDAKAAECLEWLLSKDSFECSEQREAVNAYVLVWLSGHPDVIANVETRVMPFIDRHPELLFPMLHGSAEYALSTNKKDQTQVNALVSGLKAVDRYCRSSKSLRKDPDLKLLHKLIRKKKISSWIEDQQKV
ncbi:MAG: hypothetical protein NWR73_10115 [Flavobacteriales bacterium]|nr:hypothetical protein [Flavobacteriales bacterium]